MINQSGGINLSNLGANAGALGSIASFVGGMTGLGGSGTASNGAATQGGFNVGDIFGNLLTGFVGNRFASRRISKRSVDEPSTSFTSTLLADLDPVLNAEKELLYVKKSSSKKRNLNTEMETVTEIASPLKDISNTDSVLAEVIKNIDEKEEIFAEDDEEEEDIEAITDHDISSNPVKNATLPEDSKKPEELLEGRIVNNPEELPDIPEGRIMNKKRPIFASNVIHFPSHNIIRHEKKIKFVDIEHLNPAPYAQNDVLIFQSNDLHSQQPHFDEVFRFPVLPSGNRGSKRIKFEHKEQQQDDRFQNHNIPDDRIKMVFPDRTGTGNLKFDNQDFDVKPVRFGRILSGMRPQNGNSNNGGYINNYEGPVSGNRNDYDESQFSTDRYPQESNINNVNNINNDYNGNYNDRYQHLYNVPAYNSNNPSSSQSGSKRYQRPTLSNSSYNKKVGTSTASDPNNVYVTNANGVVEYYINAAGTKVYL